MVLQSYVVKNAAYERRGHATGSASAPSAAFAAEEKSGLFLTEGANGRDGRLGVSVGGIEQASFGETSHLTNLEADLIVTGDGREVIDAVNFKSTSNVAPETDASVSAGIGDMDAGTRAQRWRGLYAHEITVDRLAARDGQLSDAAYDLLLEKIAENGIAIDFAALDSSVVPGTDVTLVLGEPTRAWRDLWVSGVRGDAVSIGHVELAAGGHLQVHDLVVDGTVLLDGTPVGDVVDWGNVASDLTPAVDTVYALGLATRRWRTIRLRGSVAGGVVVGSVLTLDAAAVNAEMRLADGTTLVVDSLKLPSGENAIADVDTGNVETDVLPGEEDLDIGTSTRRIATVFADALDVNGAPVTSDADGLVLEHVEMTGFDGDLGDAIECCRVTIAEPTDKTWTVASTWGDRVLLTGTGFSQAMAVWVGGVRADATVVSRTQARVTLPLADMGDSEVWVDVDVVRGDGERANASAIVYVPTLVSWVTEPQLPPIAKGMYYETTVVATAGEGTVTYASSDLPTGLTIDSTTGVISGAVDVEVVPELSWTVTASTGPTSGNSIEREFVAAYEAPSVSIGESGMALGFTHSLVPTTTGLFTFGDGTSFQLLDDRMSSNHYKPENVIAAIGDETVVAVAGGTQHTIVLTTEGGIWTAGRNSSGQLGHSGTGNVPTAPRDIRNEGDLAGRTIVSVTAAFYGTFAVDDAGTVISWGDNGSGNLARSYNFQTGSDPVPTATSVTNVVKLSSVTHHTVALTADGRVLTWGSNAYGKLGNGGTVTTWQPQTVTSSGTLSGRTVVDVAAGEYHTVVVCSDGTVHGTGRNWQGCLANSVPVGSNILRFAQLSFPTNAVSVACGDSSTYVIDDAGDVWGCGENSNGQLGIPGGDKSSFTKITGSGNPQGSLFGRSDVTAVTTFFGHVLVQCADGSVHAFGNNGNGQCGIDNGYVTVFDPVDITSQFALPPVQWTTDTLPVARDGVAYSAQFEATAGGVACTKFLSTSAMPPGLTLSEGGELAGTPSSAVVKAHEVVVTAVGPAGQAATKTFKVRYNWSKSGSLWTSGGGATGHFTSTALDGNGALWAWGDNTYNTCADSITTADKTEVRNVMTAFPSGVRLVTESGGVFTKMALSDDGRVFAWGDNRYGAVGLPMGTPVPWKFSSPYVVNNAGALVGKTVTDVFMNWFIAFALTSEKSLVCWGQNYDGQMGIDSGNAGTHIPTAFPYLDGTVEKVMGGGGTLFALDTSGQLWAWGAGSKGQMGNGTTVQMNHIPHNITSAGSLSGKTASKVESSSVVVAMMTDGSVHQWGSINGVNVSTPQAVVIPGGRTAVDVAVGSDVSSGQHLAALMSDGSLWTWGENDKGQLGNGTRTTNWTPIDISGLGSLAGKTVIELAKGLRHTVALCDDGTLHGWGDNTNGQLIYPVVSTMYIEPVELEAIPGMGPPAIVWTTDATLPPASEGVAYSVVLGATPDVVAYEVTDGALPEWASLDAATGEISGTPDDVSQTAEFTVTAYSTAAVPADRAFLLQLLDKLGAFVDAGHSTTFVVTQSGKLYTFGNGSLGQLGDNGGKRFVPTIVNTGSLKDKSITQISTGAYHATVLSSDGIVHTWGRSQYGSLGTNQQGITEKIPVAVTGGSLAGKTVTWIASGGASNYPRAFAIASDSTVHAWGQNYLGDGTATTRLVPVDITNSGTLSGKTVVKIVCGVNHTAAIDSQGGIHSWGSNGNGQCGDGTTTTRSSPVAVTGGSLSGKTVADVFCGNYHTVAIDSQGGIHSWGYNAYGQLGDGTTTQRSLPVAVTGGSLSGKTALHASCGRHQYTSTYNHSTFVVATDGSLHAFGDNRTSNLGDGTNINRSLPVLIATGTLSGKSVSKVFAGSNSGTTFAIASDSTVHAWGDGNSGKLGDGTISSRIAPVEITSSGALNTRTVTEIEPGEESTFARTTDGTLLGWGNDVYGFLGLSTGPNVSGSGSLAGKTISSTSSYINHSLILATDGSLFATGENSHGQIGNGTTPTSPYTIYSTPVAITGGSLAGKTVTSASVGQYFSVALASDGTIHTWGRGSKGCIGNGSTSDRYSPGDISSSGTLSGKTPTQIGCGHESVLVRCSDGSLHAWGTNNSYVLGDTTQTQRNAPVQVYSSGVTQVACGWFHALAIISNSIYIWGGDYDGAQGDGGGTNQFITYMMGGSLSGKTVTQVSAGYNVSAALCSDSSVHMWGRNNYGQCGIGTTVNQTTPVEITNNGSLNGKTITSVNCRYDHTVALASDGSMHVWGRGTYNQLASNSISDQTLPVQIEF